MSLKGHLKDVKGVHKEEAKEKDKDEDKDNNMEKDKASVRRRTRTRRRTMLRSRLAWNGSGTFAEVASCRTQRVSCLGPV